MSFEEAKTVFFDERAKLIDDPDHSEDEERFVLIWNEQRASFPARLSLLPEQRQCHSYHLRTQGHFQGVQILLIGCHMRKEDHFSKARKNPYASQLKKQITIRLDEESITYFKAISEDVGVPYQSLINLYLRDCAISQRKLNLNWK